MLRKSKTLLSSLQKKKENQASQTSHLVTAPARLLRTNNSVIGKLVLSVKLRGNCEKYSLLMTDVFKHYFASSITTDDNTN